MTIENMLHSLCEMESNTKPKQFYVKLMSMFTEHSDDLTLSEVSIADVKYAFLTARGQLSQQERAYIAELLHNPLVGSLVTANPIAISDADPSAVVPVGQYSATCVRDLGAGKSYMFSAGENFIVLTDILPLGDFIDLSMTEVLEISEDGIVSLG